MNCFYGQSLWPVASASLHYTPGLHSVSPPSVPFLSLSASSLGTHARVLPFISFRSGQPAVSFRSPLAFRSHVPELKAKTGSSIPPNPIRYFSFSHHTCFSPCQPAVCPAVLYAPNKQAACYWYENNFLHTFHCQLLPIPTAHHHHDRNLHFPLKKKFFFFERIARGHEPAPPLFLKEKSNCFLSILSVILVGIKKNTRIQQI